MSSRWRQATGFPSTLYTSCDHAYSDLNGARPLLVRQVKYTTWVSKSAARQIVTPRKGFPGPGGRPPSRQIDGPSIQGNRRASTIGTVWLADSSNLGVSYKYPSGMSTRTPRQSALFGGRNWHIRKV